MLVLRAVNEMHEYLLGMLSKQKKLSEILKEIKLDIQRPAEINLLIELCDELGTSFPYPFLKYDFKNNNLFNLFSEYETYLIQFYLLFNEQTKEKSDLNNYLYKQAHLGLLYEKNAAVLTDFIKNSPLSIDFLNKHQLNSNMCILQLLIEPVQYFPRFILLLNSIIDKLQIFKLDDNINLIKKLDFICHKIKNLSLGLNKFLHCHYPEEIHLYFLERMVKESLSDHLNNNFSSSHTHQEMVDLCIEQTLRTDRLRILNEYVQFFLVYLNAYREQNRTYLSIFKTDTKTTLATQEWKSFSPEYVKIFNENQHDKKKPGLIFQEGVIKLYEKAIQLLIKHHDSTTEQIAKNSLDHYIMAYIADLEDTILHFMDNIDYVPNLSLANINTQLDKVGQDNTELKNKYEYYRDIYNTINKVNFVSAPAEISSLNFL